MKNSNYIKLFLIILATVLGVIIICNLYRNYDGNKNNRSYLSKYVLSINYNELTNTTTELSSNSFIYLSYIGNKNVYDNEKKLRKVIKQYDLEDNFIYVDCTDKLTAKNTVKGLDNIFDVGNKEIVVPAIIFYKDNEPVDYIDSSEGLLNVSSFSWLLDKHEIKEKE